MEGSVDTEEVPPLETEMPETPTTDAGPEGAPRPASSRPQRGFGGMRKSFASSFKVKPLKMPQFNKRGGAGPEQAGGARSNRMKEMLGGMNTSMKKFASGVKEEIETDIKLMRNDAAQAQESIRKSFNSMSKKKKKKTAAEVGDDEVQPEGEGGEGPADASTSSDPDGLLFGGGSGGGNPMEKSKQILNKMGESSRQSLNKMGESSRRGLNKMGESSRQGLTKMGESSRQGLTKMRNSVNGFTSGFGKAKASGDDDADAPFSEASTKKNPLDGTKQGLDKMRRNMTGFASKLSVKMPARSSMSIPALSRKKSAEPVASSSAGAMFTINDDSEVDIEEIDFAMMETTAADGAAKPDRKDSDESLDSL